MSRNKGFTGGRHTPETCAIISAAHKGKPKSPEHRAKIAAALRGKPKNYRNYWTGKTLRQEMKEKIAAKLRGRTLSAEVRLKIAATSRGRRFSQEAIARRVASRLANPKHALFKEHIRALNVARWNDPEYARKMRRAQWRRPSNPEVRVGMVLEKLNPGQWEYTGDGAFIIGRCNPDFLYLGEGKMVLEVFGRYWHKPEEEFTRPAIFAKHGYETVIVWEDESDDDIENRLVVAYYNLRRRSVA